MLICWTGHLIEVHSFLGVYNTYFTTAFLFAHKNCVPKNVIIYQSCHKYKWVMPHLLRICSSFITLYFINKNRYRLHVRVCLIFSRCVCVWMYVRFCHSLERVSNQDLWIFKSNILLIEPNTKQRPETRGWHF